MSRKDDPVFNVKFVQAVERNQCLWNSTLPAYSKKEEIQKAWQDVANETKDTVRSCRERWRTIRSSFLRSLKMARTSTGRGKRKYYLSKYLQFLIPYTKTRLKHAPSNMMALRKYSSTSHLSGLVDVPQTPSQTPISTPPPMTCINNMPLPIVSSDDTKDSTSSDVAAIAEEDVVVSLVDAEAQQHLNMLYNNNNNNFNHNNNNNNNNSSNNNNNTTNNNNNNINNHNTNSNGSSRHNSYFNHFPLAANNLQQQFQQHQPLRLPPIKNEPRIGSCSPYPLNFSSSALVDCATTKSQNSANTNNNSSYTASGVNNNSISNNNNNNNNTTRATISSSTATATVDLSEFADWIKNKNLLQRHLASAINPPDADQSFLNSLHPYLKEMSGKQNRRFRQKVVALIDAILDNAD